MKMSMLEYCKVVLEKVHFDQHLFRKEYGKSLRWLSHEEGRHLRDWLAEKFGPATMSLSPQLKKVRSHVPPNLPHL